jgi:hypothetical protein
MNRRGLEVSAQASRPFALTRAFLLSAILPNGLFLALLGAKTPFKSHLLIS